MVMVKVNLTGIFAVTGGGEVANTLTVVIKSDDMIDLVYGLKKTHIVKGIFHHE